MPTLTGTSLGVNWRVQLLSNWCLAQKIKAVAMHVNLQMIPQECLW